MRHTISPLHSDGDTTHNWELKTKGKLRSTSAHCANCATARRTAHEVRRSRDTDKPVSSVFNNSHRDVSSSFRATQILRQGPVHSTLWNTSVFQDRLTHVQQIRIDVIFMHALSALRGAAVCVRPHSNIRSVARKTVKTLNSHSSTFPT